MVCEAGSDTRDRGGRAVEAGYSVDPGAVFSPLETTRHLRSMTIATSQNTAMLKGLDKTLETLRQRGSD